MSRCLFKKFLCESWNVIVTSFLEQNYEKLKLSQNKSSVTSSKAKLESVHLFLKDNFLAPLM